LASGPGFHFDLPANHFVYGRILRRRRFISCDRHHDSYQRRRVAHRRHHWWRELVRRWGRSWKIGDTGQFGGDVKLLGHVGNDLKQGAHEVLEHLSQTQSKVGKAAEKALKG
jgi:hypothetical protein